MTPSMGHGCCRLALTSFLLPLPSSLLLPSSFFWPAAVVPVARCTDTPVGNTKCPNTSVPAAVCSDSERKEAAISMDCHGGRGGGGVCEGVATEVDATPNFPVPHLAPSLSLPACKVFGFCFGSKKCICILYLGLLLLLLVFCGVEK